MHPIIKKTFGGLTKQYYFRQLFFALIFFGFFCFSIFGDLLNSPTGTKSGAYFILFFMAINTALYPYSRFVYESIMNFIIGENLFFGNAIFVFLVKLLTMTLCYSLATVIAPIGLLYLYYFHTKKEKSESS